MCALLLGNPWGELRGKLGGNIFARNLHGAYVRQYIKPVNPNTIAQATAKDAFSNVVSQYRMLTAARRGQWNEYAKTVYQPRSTSHSGRYSGYQAFIGVKMSNLRSQFLNRTYSLYDQDLATITDIQLINWNSSNYDAPDLGKINDLLVSGDEKQEYSLFDAKVNKNANVSFTLQFGKTVGSGLFRDFRDTNDNWNGFVMYMSNPVYGQNMFIQNPLYMCLGFFKPWTFNPSGSLYLQADKIKYKAVDAFDLTKYKAFPPVGRWVRLTLYGIDTKGQLKIVGSVDRQILNSI